ncbi:MAG: peptidase, partial [SAR202 cluster bacterium]|nr:peptidase [SAR202 cluster bacterium]
VIPTPTILLITTPTPTTIPTATPTTIPTATPTTIPTATPTPYSTQIPQSEYPTAECVDGTKSYNMNPWDGTTCSNNGGISMYLENPVTENSSGNYSYTPTPTPAPTR